MSASEPADAPPRRRLAPQERRAQLVDVAAELFTRYGGRFTSSQLALAAGVSEGTVFRYFPDMSSLMRAARRAAVGLDQLLPELREASRHADIRERLRAAGGALTERIVETARLVEASGVARGQPPHDEIEEVFEALTPLFHNSGAHGVSQRQQAAMFLGLLVSGTLFSHAAADAPTQKPLGVGEIVDIFLDGIRSGSHRPG